MILKVLRGRRPRRRNQLGQGLVLFALMFVVLIGIVGLATDTAVAYAYSVSMERGAAAAALAGVPYMTAPPSPGVGALALQKACDEARRNGYVAATDASNPPIVTCGFANPNALLSVARNGDNDMVVKITVTVPTFMTAFLGFKPYPTSREAEAGYLPPISIGQPGPQLGATASALGSGNNFYIERFKGYNKYRSEGDAYTPSSYEGSGTPATDVHVISNQLGNETAALNDGNDPTCGGAVGSFAMPCGGGQNYRITIPAGAVGELQVYNAAFAPDFNANSTYKPNQCENSKNLGKCSSGSNYTMKEGVDDGMGGSDPAAGTGPARAALLADAHCGIVTYKIDCAVTAKDGTGANSNPAVTRQNLYNAVGYTVLAVPDLFLRSNDVPLVQTKVFPVDATNYDGNQSQNGPASTQQPTYVNVMDQNTAGKSGTEVTQTYGTATYDATANANNPLNMRIYHSWTNILREDGTGDNCAPSGTANCKTSPTSPVKRTPNPNNITCPDGTTKSAFDCFVNTTAAACAPAPAQAMCLGPGTYRLRVDSLNADGSAPSNALKGDASKAYAVRVVKPGTAPDKDPNVVADNVACVGTSGAACTVGAWEDICVYTPIASGVGTIPLFQLTSDYRGATLEVEVYDVGDAGGTVDLQLLDPVTGTTAQISSGGVGDYKPSVGGRLQIFNQGDSRFGTPAGHIQPQNPSGAAPGEIVPHVFMADSFAALEATGGSGPHFNGEWVRFEIPISISYPPSAPFFNGYWQLRYTGAAANDTFTFAVRAKGGPVHLLRS